LKEYAGKEMYSNICFLGCRGNLVSHASAQRGRNPCSPFKKKGRKEKMKGGRAHKGG